MKQNNLITFEGIDGSGKTTMILKTKSYLESIGKKVFVTTETKDENSIFIKKIRSLLFYDKTLSTKTELLLFEALRNNHFEKIIEKKIGEGYIIICDRFIDSSIVYQGIKGINKKDIIFLNNFATNKKLPSLTFLLDINFYKARKRVNERKEKNNKFDEYDEVFFNKARDLYYWIYKKNKKRIKLIDSSREPDIVFKDIKKEIDKWIK